MKSFIFCILFGFASLSGVSQKNISKTLYFYQDSVFISECGGVILIEVYYFVSDTLMTKNNSNNYYIAIACPENHGKDFLRKGRKYLLTLNKNFKKIKNYMIPTTLELFLKQKNFFVAQDIVALSD